MNKNNAKLFNNVGHALGKLFNNVGHALGKLFNNVGHALGKLFLLKIETGDKG